MNVSRVYTSTIKIPCCRTDSYTIAINNVQPPTIANRLNAEQVLLRLRETFDGNHITNTDGQTCIQVNIDAYNAHFIDSIRFVQPGISPPLVISFNISGSCLLLVDGLLSELFSGTSTELIVSMKDGSTATFTASDIDELFLT